MENNIISITYCVPCRYEKRARAAADELRSQLGIEATLIASKGGVFKVHMNDMLLTQRTSNYFPDSADIVKIVGEALKQSVEQ